MSFLTSDLHKTLTELLSEHDAFNGSYCSVESRMILLHFSDGLRVQIDNEQHVKIIKSNLGVIHQNRFIDISLNDLALDMEAFISMFF